MTGVTSSTEATFPVQGGPDLTFNGDNDAFVAKVAADGAELVYAGYIGGSDYDWGSSIAVDGAGAAYVTGGTWSTETTFPVQSGPDLTFNGNGDAFVAKVAADGSGLVYAGYIGGSGSDESWGIAVDGAGAAYVTGWTYSTQTTFPVQDGPDLTFNGGYDAFVAKISSIATLTVTKAGTGSGTVTSNPVGVDCGTDCEAPYNNGTVVTLTAAPATGSTFAGWSGDLDCSDGKVTLTANKTCTATFNLQQFALKVTRAGNGSGTVTSSPTGINCGADCQESYNSGTVVTLTATPATGSTFACWSGDVDCGDGKVTMAASKTCTATFNTDFHRPINRHI